MEISKVKKIVIIVLIILITVGISISAAWVITDYVHKETSTVFTEDLIYFMLMSTFTYLLIFVIISMIIELTKDENR